MEGKQQHLLYRIHVKIKAYNSPSNSNIMLATKDIKYFLEFKLKKNTQYLSQYVKNIIALTCNEYNK